MAEKSYIVSAFAGKSARFLGSPACVVLIDEKLSDKQMLAMAAKNGLPETAFLSEEDSGRYSLRWFTPDIEMDLCGHATLASAYIVYEVLGRDRAIFDTCEGEIRADKSDGKYILDFPSRPARPAKLPENIYNALSIKPKEVYLSRDYILRYENEDQIRSIEIDRAEFDKINLDPGGIAVTASDIFSGGVQSPGGEVFDFVSRFFTPQATILEDPVTGSAHCTLVPFWAERLGRSKLHAAQLSGRGGELFCELKNGRVLIGGYVCQ